MISYETYMNTSFRLGSGSAATDFIRAKFDYGTRQRRTARGYDNFFVSMCLTLEDSIVWKSFWLALNYGTDQFVTNEVINGDVTYNKVARFTGTYDISQIGNNKFLVSVPIELIQSGSAQPPEAPSAIIDFNATDNETAQVTLSWSNATGFPVPTYDIYTGTTLIQSNVTSPYINTYTGTRDYHIKAINTEGTVSSNTDSGTGLSGDVDLTANQVAHYLLNNNADDSFGTFDGTPVGTVDFQGDQLDPLSGSVTIPDSSASSCSYWKDTGGGMVFTYTTTIITSLATDNYSNLRMYSDIKDATFQTELEAEGYYPKPLTEPTITNLVAHYPLTGTAEDSMGNYDSTENSATYKDDAEFGSVYDGGGSITVNTTAVGLSAWNCYLINTGSGWVFTKSPTILTSLTANDYRNLRLYSAEPSIALQDEIQAYELNFRDVDIDNGLGSYYPLKNNSEDNYYNQLDATDDAGVTYDGIEATLPNGDNITFPNLTGFVEAYYTKDGIVLKTTTESDLNTLTNCTLKNVRKYTIALSTDRQSVIGYTA